MRIGVFADLHGNLPALQVLLARFRKEGVEKILNLGDTTALGPDTPEVIDTLASLPIPAVHLYGNHDLSVIGIETKQPELIRPLEKAQHAYVRSGLNKAHLDWIKNCREEWVQETEHGRILAKHYATDKNRLYHPVQFDPTEDDLRRRFLPDNLHMILYGHHHGPLLIGHDPVFVNPGSAGCPHQRSGIARAGILDTAKKEDAFMPFIETYDAEPVIERIYKSEDPTKLSTLSIFFGVHIP